MLNVRLPENIEEALDNIAKREKITKTEIVKEALAKYIAEKQKISAFEAGKDLFGCDESNINDGSTTYKEQFRRKIHEKYSD